GDGLLLFGRRACLEVLLQRPVSIEAEAKIGMLRGELHRFVDNAAMDGGHLSLIVRIAHVEVNVGDEEKRPFLLRIDECFGVLLVPRDFGRSMRGEFGNREGQLILAEVLVRCESLMIMLARESEVDGSAAL